MIDTDRPAPADPSATAAPRKRLMLWLGGLLVAAILVGLLSAWLARGDFQGRYAIPEAGHEAAAPAIIQTPPPVPLPRAQPAPPPRPTLAPPVTDDEVQAPDGDDDSSRMAGAIERAARKALDRGEPVRWHKAGERGYVVVSEPRDDGIHTCRNVSATIEGDDGRTQSNSHLWCIADDEDGDWEPVQ